MHKLMVVAVLASSLVACGNSREKQCQKVLDQFLADAPKHIEDSLGSVAPGTDREQLRLQAGKEVSAMREKFVDVCKKADKFEPQCFDDEQRKGTPKSDLPPEEKEKALKRSEECHKMRDAIEKVVFQGI